MAQKKTPRSKLSSQRSEREQRLLYEQKREAQLIEDILNEFKNFDENAIPQVSSEELKDIEPEYGFEMPDYVKALFSGVAEELSEEPIPTEDDFKLDPKIFEPEPEPELEPEPEPEEEPEIDFFAELFVKSSPSIEANNEKTAAIAVKEIEAALEDIEKTKVVPPVVTESAGVEIAADDHSKDQGVEPETKVETEIEAEEYSFDDYEDDEDDMFSTRELRSEFFTAEIDDKVREMFTASLDNEAKKLGTRKMRSALATPEELAGRYQNIEDFEDEVPQKKKKGRGIGIFMLIVFCGIFLFAGYKFSSTYISQMQESKALDNIASVVTHIKNGDNGTAKVNGVEIELDAEDDGSGRILQYQQLAEMNDDMIGWINVPGTKINYPVMYTPDDPEYYLHRDFIGEYSGSGVLFVDANCDVENGDNQIIYGHNMKNDTMFGTLDNYAEKEFWEDHQYIYYDSLYEEHVYQVVCVFESRVLNKDEAGFRYYRFYGSETEEEFNDYIEGIENLQLYDTGVDVSYGDKLITLSTCAYFTDEGRFVVVAKQVS